MSPLIDSYHHSRTNNNLILCTLLHSLILCTLLHSLLLVCVSRKIKGDTNEVKIVKHFEKTYIHVY